MAELQNTQLALVLREVQLSELKQTVEVLKTQDFNVAILLLRSFFKFYFFYQHLQSVLLAVVGRLYVFKPPPPTASARWRLQSAVA